MINRYSKILLKDEMVEIIGLGLSDISSFSGKKPKLRRKLSQNNRKVKNKDSNPLPETTR